MRRKLILSLIVVLLVGCVEVPIGIPTTTPLPGWRTPVYQLLLEDASFPEGWENAFPGETEKDPTVNYVFRIWGRVSLPGTVEQAISRAYSEEKAIDAYQKKQSQFTPTPSIFDDIFIPFETPSKVTYVSGVADEWKFACGWRTTPYCVLIARYRNYITEMSLPLETEDKLNPGEKTLGLTYSEIESILIEVDSRFANFLSENP